MKSVCHRRANSVTVNRIKMFRHASYNHDLSYGTEAPPIAETNWAREVFYLLNIYQTTSIPRGGEIDENDVTPGAMLDDINTTTDPGYPGNLVHQSIDDNALVQARIVEQLHQLMFR